MKKRIISLLLAAALAASLCACGEQQAADGGSLRLYCPADLSEQNKSAGGGDAVQGIAIPWADITAGDRGRQQQAQYIMELLLGGCTAEGFIAPIPVGDAAAELYRHRRNGVGGHEQRIRPADRY